MKFSRLLRLSTVLLAGLLLTGTTALLSQLRKITDPRVLTEGNIYEQEGVLYSDAIVVKFKENVFSLAAGQVVARKDIIEPKHADLASLIGRIEANHGEVRFLKQVPSATWGDVMRRNRETGQWVRIEDLSQLFSVKFSEPMDLEWAIGEFKRISSVEYAHNPISIVYFVEPNDVHYQNGEQWGLSRVNAAKA